MPYGAYHKSEHYGGSETDSSSDGTRSFDGDKFACTFSWIHTP